MEMDGMPVGCEVTRRDALKVMVASGFVLVGLMLGVDADAAPTWVKAGPVADFEVGVPKKVTLPGKQVVFIVQKDKKTYTAVSAVCTHKGKEINWDAATKRYVCPAHGATFDIDGKDPKTPAMEPLATATAKVQGKDVVVDAEKLPMVKGKKPESAPSAP